MAQTNKHRESTWREQGSTRTRHGNKHATTQGRQTHKLDTDRHRPYSTSPLTAGFPSTLNTNRTNPPRVGGGGPEQGRRADRTRQPKNTQTRSEAHTSELQS